MRNKRPFPLLSLLFPLVHVTRCIHVTLHVALHLLKRLPKKKRICGDGLGFSPEAAPTNRSSLTWYGLCIWKQLLLLRTSVVGTPTPTRNRSVSPRHHESDTTRRRTASLSTLENLTCPRGGTGTHHESPLSLDRTIRELRKWCLAFHSGGRVQ